MVFVLRVEMLGQATRRAADFFAGGVRTAPATQHGYGVEGGDTNER